MSLREARCLFTRNLGRLIEYAFQQGYEVAIGEAVRDPATAARNASLGIGTVNSLHILGLAADINLYRDGAYLARTEDHMDLGTFWKGLHPLNRWGGDFKRQDGNHYSLTWQGRA